MTCCRNCQHYREGTLFELCMHSSSAYTAAGEDDHHTVGHMRSARGPCGETAQYFQPIVTKLP